MNKFKKGGFRKGGGDFGGRPRFGGGRDGSNRGGGNRGGGHLELFPAVCADCGKDCEVPFRPTGDKPVYCRDCFGKPGRSNVGRNDRPSGDFRRDASPQREYRSEPAKAYDESGHDAIKRHLDKIESRVDRVLELLNQKTESPIVSAPVTKDIPPAENAKTAKSR